MPRLLKVVGEKPAKVYGTAGMLVEFDADGYAEVSEDVAKHFAKIPGYQLTDYKPDKPAKQVVTDDRVDSDDTVVSVEADDFDFEDFKTWTWHKQRTAIVNGEVPAEVLPLIVNGKFTDSVKASAKERMEG